MKLASFSRTGVVRLEFDQLMIQEYETSNLNETHLQLEVIPYENEMIAYMDFTWKTKSFEETHIELLIDFKDPL